ncbi:rCG47793 [Rattus norvegicus]|uniref:RCG47793 n=1 Tax=Rattus norvegicus TaxID=10116 RepID=A6HYE7_RAT|nr:rCG47793 [Rattus norvegicus]
MNPSKADGGTQVTPRDCPLTKPVLFTFKSHNKVYTAPSPGTRTVLFEEGR